MGSVLILLRTNSRYECRIEVESSLPKDALAHLAASCLFDRIEMHDEEAGEHVYLEGSKLVSEAFKVKG